MVLDAIASESLSLVGLPPAEVRIPPTEGEGSQVLSASEWAKQQFGLAELGDRRLNVDFVRIEAKSWLCPRE